MRVLPKVSRIPPKCLKFLIYCFLYARENQILIFVSCIMVGRKEKLCEHKSRHNQSSKTHQKLIQHLVRRQKALHKRLKIGHPDWTIYEVLSHKVMPDMNISEVKLNPQNDWQILCTNIVPYINDELLITFYECSLHRHSWFSCSAEGQFEPAVN